MAIVIVIVIESLSSVVTYNQKVIKMPKIKIYYKWQCQCYILVRLYIRSFEGFEEVLRDLKKF